MRLQNLNGYLRFPGSLPVARIRLEYSNRPRIADRFVPFMRQEVGEGNPAKPEPEHEIGSTREIPVDTGSEETVTVEILVDDEAEALP